MAKVIMKDTDYYKSGEHTINSQIALAAGRETIRKQTKERIDLYNLNPKICLCKDCNNPIPYKLRNTNKFCSRSCSGTHGNQQRKDTGYKMSTESKDKTSKSLLGNKNSKGKIKYCPVSWCLICNTYMPNTRKKLCSDECTQIYHTRTGQRLATLNIKRSKQEVELFNICNNYFKNVSHNISITDGWDADIILNDQKIAILWNGPWHYKQMPLHNHSLSQVQTRDKIKTRLFTDIGWTVLIFEDRHYTPATAFDKIQMVVDKRIELLHPAYETSVLPLN